MSSYTLGWCNCTVSLTTPHINSDIFIIVNFYQYFAAFLLLLINEFLFCFVLNLFIINVGLCNADDYNRY